MRSVISSHGPSHAEARATLGAVCFGIWLTATGCTLDQRTLLTPAQSGGASSSGGQGSGGGAADPGGEAGAAPLPVCNYSSPALEAGCETLVENPGFAVDTRAWTAENLGMSEAWVNTDASEDPKSGSLVVTNLNFKKDDEAKLGTAGGGAKQCLAAAAGTSYDLTADVFIPAGQGAGFEGDDYLSSAALSVFFYATNDCEGRTIGNFTSSNLSATGQWLHLEGTTLAPPETQRMAVRLATFKPFRQFTFEAHFDNILVREHER